MNGRSQGGHFMAYWKRAVAKLMHTARPDGRTCFRGVMKYACGEAVEGWLILMTRTTSPTVCLVVELKFVVRCDCCLASPPCGLGSWEQYRLETGWGGDIFAMDISR